jgi:carbamoyltransferase
VLADLKRHYEDGARQLERLMKSLGAAQPASPRETAKIADIEDVDMLREALAQREAELEAKEQVIQELARALRAYRAARLALSPVAALKRLTRKYFWPRIGSFHHHPPRAIRPTAPYLTHRAPPAALPSIAIVTPSYGQADFIGATVSSVLNQNYPALDYLVQDGGSTDGTTDVLATFGDTLRWDSRRDGGQAQAINLGFSKVSGEVMGYLNSDDLLLPGALHTVGHFFATHPEIDVVYGDRLVIDRDGFEIGAWRLPRHQDGVLNWADFIPQETLFWRRSAWERAGGKIDEDFRFALDWDLILRLRDSGARFAHLPTFLGAFRVHADQKTSAQMADIGAGEMKRLRQRALEFDPSHHEIRRAILPYVAAHVITDLKARVADRLRFGAVTRTSKKAQVERTRDGAPHT